MLHVSIKLLGKTRGSLGELEIQWQHELFHVHVGSASTTFPSSPKELPLVFLELSRNIANLFSISSIKFCDEKKKTCLLR